MLDIVGRGYNGFEIPTDNNNNNLQRQQQQPGYMTNGFNHNPQDFNNNKPDPQEIDYPLSLSFQSRLRQKTQEKIQEKMKKRETPQADTKKYEPKFQSQAEYDNKSASSSSNNSHSPSYQMPEQRASPPLPANKNFGLSISGYQNQSSSSVVNGKPPQPYNPAAAYDEMVITPSRKVSINNNTNGNRYIDNDERELPVRNGGAGRDNFGEDNIDSLLENRSYVPNNSQSERKFKPTAATQ